MTQKEKDDFKIQIDQLIVKHEKELAELKILNQPIKPENSLGRISRMDAINNKSVSEAAMRSKKKKISKLKIALTKLDSPSFGKCDRCSKPIASARLMFLPESDHCVRCAR